MMHFTSRNPAVSAVIATNGKRPELLRVAVRSILDQSYRGFVEVIVVFDRVEPDRLEDIEVGENRALKIVSNTRTGGLAGGRHSGIPPPSPTGRLTEPEGIEPPREPNPTHRRRVPNKYKTLTLLHLATAAQAHCQHKEQPR